MATSTIWGERVISQSAGRVVSLEEIKRFLRIDDNESDSELIRLLAVAVANVQHLTRRQLLTCTREIRLPCFPGGRVLQLPWSPLQSVAWVKYYDTGTPGSGYLQPDQVYHYTNDAGDVYLRPIGVLHPLDAEDYLVVTDEEPGFVQITEEVTWPATKARQGAVIVRYTSGYGDDGDDVPEMLRHAVLMSLGHYYEYRSDATRQTITTIPNGVQALLNQYCVGDEFIRYDIARG